MVPAKTSPPGALSTGTDSPVIGAWFTGRPAARDAAVDRDALGRPHEHRRPDRHLLDGHEFLDAIADDAAWAGASRQAP